MKDPRRSVPLALRFITDACFKTSLPHRPLPAPQRFPDQTPGLTKAEENGGARGHGSPPSRAHAQREAAGAGAEAGRGTERPSSSLRPPPQPGFS